MINHNKKGMKDVFKLDSAENIGKKLLHGRDPSTYQGGSGGLGLVGGVAKGIVKAAGAFANTAKQYANLAKGGKVAKKTSNFRPLVTGNKVYDKKMINDAFKSRFGAARARHDAAKALKTEPQNVISNATVDRATQMRNIERGYIGKTPRWAKPPKK